MHAAYKGINAFNSLDRAMATTGPGRAHRKGISLIKLAEMFPDEQSAAQWFESVFWAHGRICPRCYGNRTYETKNANRMPYRCTDCKRYFSVKTGTVLQSSKVPLKKWVWAIFLEMTSLKGVSSMNMQPRQAMGWNRYLV